MNAGPAATGDEALDEILGGGLECKAITQFYGEPGGGKSTLCLICAAARLAAGENVLYFDTEGFSADRFTQVAGPHAEELAAGLILFEPRDFEEQGFMIARAADLLREKPFGLIVVDSITALYRAESGSGGEGQRRLARQLVMLLGYAKRHDIPVIVTNQVYFDIDTGSLTGLGGTVMRHISKTVLRIEKTGNHRRATLEKHRSRPEGQAFEFVMTGTGIRRV
jgi:DNA repair protein RadB